MHKGLKRVDSIFTCAKFSISIEWQSRQMAVSKL